MKLSELICPKHGFRGIDGTYVQVTTVTDAYLSVDPELDDELTYDFDGRDEGLCTTVKYYCTDCFDETEGRAEPFHEDC